MIVRDEGGHLVLVRQPDHATLSGQLAAVWGNAPWERPSPFPAVVLGARLHDEAWLPWEEAPTVGDDGRPQSFYEVDRVVTADLYRRGADAVTALDEYAGLLVSLHYSGFFHGHWEWQPFATPDRFPEPQGPALQRFVDRELQRQKGLRQRHSGAPDADARLARNYRLLQLWDRISLDLCRQQHDGSWHGVYPAVDPGGGGEAEWVQLRIEVTGPWSCVLDPYPLRVEPFRTRLPVVRIATRGLGDQQHFIELWSAAPTEMVEVTVRAPS